MDDQGEKFPCPCCGRRVYECSPGSSEICPICYWEDDLVQLRWPISCSGANGVSLIEAQRNYRQVGASESRWKDRVRKPNDGELLDKGWRPIDLRIDSFEDEDDRLIGWPSDRSVLYWWRDTFWRRTDRVK
nr:CPCC family cysteine-rich protein [Amycolatopsis rubida]